MSKDVILISHFYNEEFLLPHWVRHHKKLFDHAVLIDYQSTDKSVEIIRELAPDWEVRPSVNGEFDANSCDGEVMMIEKEFPGCWKTALNITEFIVCDDLKSYCNSFESKFPNSCAFHMFGGNMVDPDDRRSEYDPTQPLILQKHFGYLEPRGPRCRIIHNLEYGFYTLGRHFFEDRFEQSEEIQWVEDIFCMWFGYCPVDLVKGRTLQIQHRMSERDKSAGAGIEHIMDDTLYENRYQVFAAKSEDLFLNEQYKANYEAMKRTLYGQ